VITPAEYDTYFVPALFEPWSRELIKRAQVWKGDRVLDVACGTGIVACRIAATGAKVTGLDINAERLAQARVRATEEAVPVTFVERNAESLGFAAGSFDLVTCQQGLQFVADRAAAVREMKRVIAPGGRCVIASWCALDRNPAYAALDQVAQNHFGPGGFAGPFSLGDEAELRALLAGAKFFAIAIETVTRTVRFPDPPKFAAETLNMAADRLGATASPEAHADALAAMAPFMEGEQLVFPTASLIATARVKT
jgi:SAM-dependent methyltransferase